MKKNKSDSKLPSDSEIYEQACDYSRNIINSKNFTNIKLRKAYAAGAQYVSQQIIKNKIEKDEYGLYKNAPNYHKIRAEIITTENKIYKKKLNKIPKIIKWIFNID